MAKVKKEEKTGVDKILADLEKKYGLEKSELDTSIIVSTGSLQLNQAMGMGGTILGKMYELFGPESAGKSTVTIHQLMEYQQKFPDKKVALIDFENSFDKKYAINIGLDCSPNKFLIYQPNCLEDGYNMILNLIENEIICCAVLDSQTAAAPKKIIEGEIGDATMAMQARYNSTFCLKVKGMLNKHNCSLFVVSQLRSDIGGMSQGDKPSGGNAWKFYSDARWKIWKMNDKAAELNKTTIDIVKNKLASPFGQAKINILWGKGFDTLGEIIEYAIEFDFVKKGGSWFTYKDFKCQGIEKLKDYLEENSEELLHLEQNVMLELSGAKQQEELAIVGEEYSDIDTSEQLNIFEPKEINNTENNESTN